MPRSWAERIIWFTIAVLLCWFAADYFSRSLHHFYHDWSGWRSITGSSPNFVTKKLLPLSQIIFFLLFIFCLWQLDKLVITKENRPGHDKSPHDEKNSREQRDSLMSTAKTNLINKSKIKPLSKILQQIERAPLPVILNPFYSQRISNMLKCLDSRRMKPRISQK